MKGYMKAYENNQKKIALSIINRFVKRQKSLLKLMKTGTTPKPKYMGNTKHLNKRSGYFTKHPEWTYAFHGIGICFKNSKTGEYVDFDFGINMKVGGFDDWRLFRYSRYEIMRLALHPKKYIDFAHIEKWESILPKLEKEKLIKKGKNTDLFFLS